MGLGENLGRLNAQCHLGLNGPERSEVVVGRTPWSAADALVGLLGLEEADFTGEQRVRGTRADQGSAPPLNLSPQLRENRVALG
jgi:hypothetical protein